MLAPSMPPESPIFISIVETIISFIPNGSYGGLVRKSSPRDRQVRHGDVTVRADRRGTSTAIPVAPTWPLRWPSHGGGARARYTVRPLTGGRRAGEAPGAEGEC